MPETADAAPLAILGAADNGGGISNPYHDDATNRDYIAVYSGGSNTEAGSTPGTLVGYTGADSGAYTPGKQATLYDTAGNFQSTFAANDPNAKGFLDYAVPIFLGAVAGGAFLAPAAAGGAAVADGGIAATTGSYVPWEAGFEGTGAISGADAIAGAGTVSGVQVLGTAAATGAATAGSSIFTASNITTAIKTIAGLVLGAGGSASTPATITRPTTTTTTPGFVITPPVVHDTLTPWIAPPSTPGAGTGVTVGAGTPAKSPVNAQSYLGGSWSPQGYLPFDSQGTGIPPWAWVALAIGAVLIFKTKGG